MVAARVSASEVYLTQLILVYLPPKVGTTIHTHTISLMNSQVIMLQNKAVNLHFKYLNLV